MAINQKNRKLQLHELVDSIDVLDTKEEKINQIRRIVRGYPAFNDYVRGLFDDNIQFALPEGRPPFTPSGENHPTSWNKEHLKLRYFVKSAKYAEMNQVKRETMFIQLLEGIHPKDAILVADMADKRHSSTLTKELLNEAVPGLIR